MNQDWALVTGASRGIGRAIALDLATVPYHVVVNYQSSEERAAEVVGEIESRGGTAELLRMDVADREQCQERLQVLEARLGAPRVLVNNAGVLRDGLMVWMEGADWDQVLRTNLDGFFNVTRPLLKGMVSARRGRIINITSTAGQIGNAGQVNYSASKAGLIGATRSLAREIARRDVTVNAVAPGFIETEMTGAVPAEEVKRRVPAARMGRPEEVAAVVRFLAGEGAGYITGQVISVNGGLV